MSSATGSTNWEPMGETLYNWFVLAKQSREFSGEEIAQMLSGGSARARFHL